MIKIHAGAFPVKLVASLQAEALVGVNRGGHSEVVHSLGLCRMPMAAPRCEVGPDHVTVYDVRSGFSPVSRVTACLCAEGDRLEERQVTELLHLFDLMGIKKVVFYFTYREDETAPESSIAQAIVKALSQSRAEFEDVYILTPNQAEDWNVVDWLAEAGNPIGMTCILNEFGVEVHDAVKYFYRKVGPNKVEITDICFSLEEAHVDPDLVIPELLNGCRVVSIAGDAFEEGVCYAGDGGSGRPLPDHICTVRIPRFVKQCNREAIADALISVNRIEVDPFNHHIRPWHARMWYRI